MISQFAKKKKKKKKKSVKLTCFTLLCSMWSIINCWILSYNTRQCKTMTNVYMVMKTASLHSKKSVNFSSRASSIFLGSRLLLFSSKGSVMTHDEFIVKVYATLLLPFSMYIGSYIPPSFVWPYHLTVIWVSAIRGRVNNSLQPSFFSLGAFIQRWQCLHQV